MSQRFDINQVMKLAPQGVKLLGELDAYTKSTDLDPKLRELVIFRASQINGCVYCLTFHAADARKLGESEMRLYCLSAWEESSLYTEMEKAALELTEHITLLPSLKVPDDVYHNVRKYFSETQYIHLTMLIMMINSWNRMSIAMGFQPEAE
ncbi:carboxymuconolactone decarboxylase family protein [Paenibacillus favisporus]|uniref:carboxymuconolactone decarboxylase family protein n=1 Tax=Paenibacillus favisporus TaxID=221028 RepID=UPI002DBF4CDC|nr:carboxymuconolactone decarboxylase family protein [Paenibacillus favisporus]MEC0177098.1 carboxymuconolactone decarboxylase family protein [Paenibacillus favisporus]